MQSIVETLFPNGTFRISEFLKDPHLLRQISNLRVLVVPKWDLLIEYQGPISYAEQIIEERPNLSRFTSKGLTEVAKKTGLRTISVPFWWNRSLGPMLAELLRLRKDLFEERSSLSRYKEEAQAAVLTPETVSLRSLQINKGYLKLWSQDRRFQHLFISSK